MSHRSVVVLAGDLLWAKSVVDGFSDALMLVATGESCAVNTLIYTEHPDLIGQVNRKTYTHHLGTENKVLFFVDPELNIDALAALSGTLVAGGLCFIWIDTNRNNHQYFLARFSRFISQSPDCYWINQQDSPDDFEVANNDVGISSEVNINIYQQQQCATDNIIALALAKKAKPLVLTADRGRGKTSALALASAHLLLDGQKPLNIIVTAPNRAALGVFYHRLSQQFTTDDAQHITFSQGRYTSRNSAVVYMPIDQIIKQQPEIDLLLVDEAAGVPVYLLEQLVSHYPRIVFSSTVHGYEGAGKGFTLKFLPMLNKQFQQYQSVHLSEPMRWAKGDPLEKLLFDTCLLNAELSDVNELKNKNTLDYQHITRAQLMQSDEVLAQVFAVLVTAHYQTKPSDLKLLLDNSHAEIFVAFNQHQQVCAVALCLHEGGVEPALVKAISEGKRRLKNHFLPQSILTQCMNDKAFDLSYLRVMRIAVHPQLQGQGIGQALLDVIAQWAAQEKIDCLGTSYAANVEVCSFWFKANYCAVRLGFNADASSGEHSLLMLKGLTVNSKAYVKKLTQSFYQSFDYLLTDEYQQLPVALVHLILSHGVRCDDKYALSYDKELVKKFALGQAQYSCVVYVLHQWMLGMLKDSKVADTKWQPVIERILMKKPIEQVCAAYGFTGKKALSQYLIETVHSSLE